MSASLKFWTSISSLVFHSGIAGFKQAPVQSPVFRGFKKQEKTSWHACCILKPQCFLTCSPVEFFHDGIRGDKFDGLPCWGTIHPEVCTAFPVLRMLEESFEAWVVEQLSAAPHPSKINMPKIAALRNLKMNFEFKHPTND